MAQVKPSQEIQTIAQATIKVQNLRQFGGKIKALAVSPDGKTLCKRSEGYAAKRVDSSSESVVFRAKAGKSLAQ